MTLFIPSNYRFSTKAKGRKETLYFVNPTATQTGRLRQQHQSGPCAKIDKKAKLHLFLSHHRYESLVVWYERHKRRLPCFYPCELQAKNGKRHIEFACVGKSVSGWHKSEGIVRINKRHLKSRIDCALKCIRDKRLSKR